MVRIAVAKEADLSLYKPTSENGDATMTAIILGGTALTTVGCVVVGVAAAPATILGVVGYGIGYGLAGLTGGLFGSLAVGQGAAGVVDTFSTPK